jgi:hypothetical protein
MHDKLVSLPSFFNFIHTQQSIFSTSNKWSVIILKTLTYVGTWQTKTFSCTLLKCTTKYFSYEPYLLRNAIAQNWNFPVHFFYDTRQTYEFVVPFLLCTRQSIFSHIQISSKSQIQFSPKKCILNLKNFLLYTYNMWDIMLNFGRFV